MTIDIIDCIDNKKIGRDWKATADTYWFRKKCEKVLACFFWVKNNKLILAYKGEVYINTQIDTYNKKINGYLEMTRKE